MPNYERYKYCKCGEIAYHECNCGCYHPDEDFSGWATPPKDSEKTDHNKWLCDDCLEIEETKNGN